MSIAQVSYKNAINLVKTGINIDRPVILFGPPGIGKTALGNEIERTDKSVKYMNFNVSQMDTIDYRGLPDLSDYSDSDAEQVTRWRIPDLFHKINKQAELNKFVLVGLDECSQASAATQGVLYQLIQQRRVGPHTLKDNVRFVMMGNIPKHGAGIDRKPNPILLNRGFVAELENMELDTWMQWAFRNNIHPAITAFHSHNNGSFLCKFDSKQLSSPTPRSWESASLALNHLMPHSDASTFSLWDSNDVVIAMCAAVGKEASVELGLTLENLKNIPNIKEVMSGKFKIPKNRAAAILSVHTATEFIDTFNATAIVKYISAVSESHGDELISVFISKSSESGSLQKTIANKDVMNLMQSFGGAISKAL